MNIKEDAQDHVDVAFSDGTVVQASFIVATDGIHSRVRLHIAPHSDPGYSGQMGIGGTITTDQLRDVNTNLELPCMMFGAAGLFAIMPVSYSGDEIGWFTTLEEDDRGREGWTKLEANKDEMAEMLASRFVAKGTHSLMLVRALCERTVKSSLSHWP